MAIRFQFLVVVVLLAACAVPSSRAHSFLTSPQPYTLDYNTKYCRGIECTSACPIEHPNLAANTVENPAATWQRGATVTIRWAKNNHDGGFFRLAMVPVGAQMNRPMHTELAFLYGCWQTGEEPCSGVDECGTDRKHIAYHRDVVIPTVLPDGNYVLGWTWYGGTRGDVGGFQDFYSCSHIRISGGDAVQESWPVGWQPGDGEHVKDDMCFTSTERLEECGNTGGPCMGRPAHWRKPAMRAYVWRKDVEKAMTMQESGTDVMGGDEDNGKPLVPGGLCKGRFCCDAKCGKCGGPGCGRRFGGEAMCCMRHIRRANRKCGGNVKPPCMMS